MDCKKVKKNIDFYFDNELSSDTKAQTDEHLASCDECRKVYDAERSVRSAMAELSQTQAPDSLHDRVFEAIEAIDAERFEEEYGPAHVVRPSFNYKPWCLAAACIMLLVVVRAGVWMDSKPAVTQDNVAQSYSAGENMRMADTAATAETGVDTYGLEAAAEPEVINSAAQTSDAVVFDTAKELAPESETKNERMAEKPSAVAQDSSEETEAPALDEGSTPGVEAATSGAAGGGGGSDGGNAVPQIIVRNVSFVISEKDREAVTALGIDGMTEEEAEAALYGAGIAFSKEEASEDRTEEYRVLNVQRISIEAAIAAKQGTDLMAEGTQEEIQALTDQLEDVISRQDELIDINNTTIISIGFTQTEAE